MSLASLVAFVMLALLIGWVLLVLAATFHQMDDELRRDARTRGR